MKTIDQAGDLKGKKVFLRVDFDVPVGDAGEIREKYRIVRQRDTLHYLLDQGAKVVIAGHIGFNRSFEWLLPQFQEVLGVPIEWKTGDGPVVLLENLRMNPGEQANDPDFAQEIVAGCDIYVNNAFAVCHRAHASVVAAASLLPAYAGLLVAEEVSELSGALNAPAEGTVLYLAGAKGATKVPVIQHFLNRAQAIAVGGIPANDALQELGMEVGSSPVDENPHELLKDLDLHDPRIHLPTDFGKDGDCISDLGPESAAVFAALAKGAKLIIWNGPMGKFEDERFMAGTTTVARGIAESSAKKIIGGGDTIAAVDKLGLLDKMGFVSTGGGAMLAFLAGQQLPGLKALSYYE